MGGPEDGKVTKHNVYMDDAVWEELMTLGRKRKASASAQLVALARHYLEVMNSDQREAILEEAATISRGARGGQG